jgi:hypothetical protein
MPGVSATHLDLASRPKGELAALFDAGTPPDVRALAGFEFRGYNQPRAAALLDYGQGGNPRYDISRILRDYVVRLRTGSDDLLLGKAYFAVAGTRLAHT